MNLNWDSSNSLPNTAERAKVLAHHIVKIPEWASFTSLSQPEKQLHYPELRACAALTDHIRSLTPLDPSTTSGFSDTQSFKGMLFSYPMFQYDETHRQVMAYGLLRKTELASHKNISSIFARHGLPAEEIIDLYSINNIQVIDRVTHETRIQNEREFIARLRLEFEHILKQATPEDGFRIISNPIEFQGRDQAVSDFLAELNAEHPFVVADRRMPHNLRVSNILSHFDSQFPKKERQEFFVQVLREALQDFPWSKYPLFANLQEVQTIPTSLEKSNTDFLHWYARELIPAVLGTYFKHLHSFATHGWVTPQNITIVGMPTDLDSVHGPEITGDPIYESRMQKDYGDARTSLFHLCRSFKMPDTSLAYQNLQRAYTT